MKRDDKLKLQFNKKMGDIEGCVPLDSEGRWDLYLLFQQFLSNKMIQPENRSLFEELQIRGYDITTVKFEIARKQENDDYVYEPPLNLKLDLDSLRMQLNNWGFKLDKNSLSDDYVRFYEIRHGKIWREVIFTKSKYQTWFVCFNQQEKAIYSKELLSILYKILDLLEEGKFFLIGSEIDEYLSELEL